MLCTGNSCRSIIAEALINYLGKGKYEAVSAGSHPTGVVHARSLETLKRHGIDPGQPRSKSWQEFAGQSFDAVVTVCDRAAGESCPLFHGQPKTLHWSTTDPAAVTGSEAEVSAAFDKTFLSLKRYIDKLLS